MNEITIATSWNDVTLEQFEKLQQVNIENPEAEQKVIAILTNKTVDEIYDLPYQVYYDLLSKIDFLKTEPKKYSPSPKITIENTTFDVTLSPQTMTAGQFLDYKTLIGMDDIDKKLARLMMCFMIPEGHSYNDGYNTEEIIDILYKNMSVVEVTAYSNFFMVLYQAYSKALVEFSIRELKKDKKMKKDKKKFLVERLNEVKALMNNGGCLQ